MPTRRQRRVAEQIHRELSTLLMFEVRDPRLALMTITDVEITQDLLLAHIYYSTLGDQDVIAGIQEGLEHAKGYLRTQLAGRIRLRFAPELFFHLDRSADYGQHIDELLDRLAHNSIPDAAAEGGQSEDEPGPA